MGEKGKVFFIAECQLRNIKGMMEIDIHQFTVIVKIVETGRSCQWMLSLVDGDFIRLSVSGRLE